MNSHEVKYGEFNSAIVVGVNKMDRFKIPVFVYFANYTTPSCNWTCVRGSDLTTLQTIITTTIKTTVALAHSMQYYTTPQYFTIATNLLNHLLSDSKS